MANVVFNRRKGTGVDSSTMVANITGLDTQAITILEDSLAIYHAPVLECEVEGQGIRWNWTEVA